MLCNRVASLALRQLHSPHVMGQQLASAQKTLARLGSMPTRLQQFLRKRVRPQCGWQPDCSSPNSFPKSTLLPLFVSASLASKQILTSRFDRCYHQVPRTWGTPGYGEYSPYPGGPAGNARQTRCHAIKRKILFCWEMRPTLQNGDNYDIGKGFGHEQSGC